MSFFKGVLTLKPNLFFSIAKKTKQKKPPMMKKLLNIIHPKYNENEVQTDQRQLFQELPDGRDVQSI